MAISVVIATHNRAQHLAATLDHLARQDYEPGDEVVVVDNASSDRTADVIASAARRFPAPLVVVRETQNGKGHAINAGIAAARGSILALTDDDVLVDDDWVLTVRKLFRDTSLDLVGGRVDPNWERPAPPWLALENAGCYTAMCSPLALQHYGDAQPLGARTAVGANLVVRREVVRAVGGFNVKLAPRNGTLLRAEDHEFCARVTAAGYRCEYRPELRVRHFVPASRLRMSYYLRWFFWSGVAHAILGSDDPQDEDGNRRAVPRYFVREALRHSTVALTRSVSGRFPAAAAAATDVAFALGYVAYHKPAWLPFLRVTRENT